MASETCPFCWKKISTYDNGTFVAHAKTRMGYGANRRRINHCTGFKLPPKGYSAHVSRDEAKGHWVVEVMRERDSKAHLVQVMRLPSEEDAREYASRFH